jgi:hypothetical protein
LDGDGATGESCCIFIFGSEVRRVQPLFFLRRLTTIKSLVSDSRELAAGEESVTFAEGESAGISRGTEDAGALAAVVAVSGKKVSGITAGERAERSVSGEDSTDDSPLSGVVAWYPEGVENVCDMGDVAFF